MPIGHLAGAFDEAVRVQPVASGRLRGVIAPGWDVFGTPNGGYVAAIAVEALRTSVDLPDPLSVTTHFLAPARVGPVDIDVTPVRSGGRHATAMATLRQDERPLVVAVGTFTTLPDDGEPAYQRAEPPDLPPPEQSLQPAPTPVFEPPALTRQVDLRVNPGHAGFALGTPPGTAEISGWLRFADGRDPDTASLPLFADSLPPTVYNAGWPLGWAPTVELTVHARARPAAGWLQGRFTTRLLVHGYFEADGELWDAEGRLVALSRQLAIVPQAAAP